MKSKIVRIRRALAVPIPPEIAMQLRLKVGDELEVLMDPPTGSILLRVAARYIEGGKLTEEFRKLSRDLLRRRARPSATNATTVATGIRRCRIHGTPPICAGSVVILVNPIRGRQTRSPE